MGQIPEGVVIMNNATIYHTGKAVSLIKEYGAIPIFLPAYSLDLMPIKECFSKVRSYLRAYYHAAKPDEIDDTQHSPV